MSPFVYSSSHKTSGVVQDRKLPRVTTKPSWTSVRPEERGRRMWMKMFPWFMTFKLLLADAYLGPMGFR